MRSIGVKIPATFRTVFFILLLVSWGSGVAFYIFSRFLVIDGDFGPEKHSWQFPILQAHGAAAFLMMIAFGSLLSSHVPASWKTKRMRWLGIGLVVLVGLQIVSAYVLYYVASDEWRNIVANIHFILGVSLPFLLAVHIVEGVRSRGRKRGISKNSDLIATGELKAGSRMSGCQG